MIMHFYINFIFIKYFIILIKLNIIIRFRLLRRAFFYALCVSNDFNHLCLDYAFLPLTTLDWISILMYVIILTKSTNNLILSAVSTTNKLQAKIFFFGTINYLEIFWNILQDTTFSRKKMKKEWWLSAKSFRYFLSIFEFKYWLKSHIHILVYIII
jgi:hypothetical protein